jgi:hypothetical protein
MVGRVAKVKMTFFLLQWRVVVEWSREGGWQQWCGFNASISAREGRRRDEALPEDEAGAVSSSWLHRKEAWHDAAAW